MSDTPVYNPLISDEPYADYAALRGRCPVSHTGPIDTPFYVAIDHSDVKAIETGPEWSARYGISPVFQKSIGFFSDGKIHSEFRRIFARRLSHANLVHLTPTIGAIAAELLDAMLAKGDGVDFHDDFALPLPVRVIAILLGIPGHDFFKLKALSDNLMANAFGVDNSKYLAVYSECNAFFEHYLCERETTLREAGNAAGRPEHVGTILPDDWISDALCQPYQGRNLTRAEQHIVLMGLLVGGNETTTSLLTNLLWRLLEAPERWELLKAQPELVANAIEESLRFDSPTMAMFRTSLCPVTLGGVDIPAKSKIMLGFAAANRDPAAFEAPDEFRIDRSRKELMNHLAFGIDAHACIGAPLSRLEARIVMTMLIERMPDVALDGPAPRNIGWNFWGRKSLPIRIGKT